MLTMLYNWWWRPVSLDTFRNREMYRRTYEKISVHSCGYTGARRDRQVPSIMVELFHSLGIIEYHYICRMKIASPAISIHCKDQGKSIMIFLDPHLDATISIVAETVECLRRGYVVARFLTGPIGVKLSEKLIEIRTSNQVLHVGPEYQMILNQPI